MAHEIEIKLRVRDENALRRALKRLGARPTNPTSPRIHEQNVIFDTPQGGLAKHGQLLRIRTEASASGSKRRSAARPARTILTFKRPPAPTHDQSRTPEHFGRHKVREELELEITDSSTLTRIFDGLGMRGWFRYEKYRTTYHLPRPAWAKGLLLEFDETPIGTFLELEGPAEAIDHAASELGYTRQDYILRNYLALYIEQCRREGLEPTNMLFAHSLGTPRLKKSK